jgi:UDP-N-acetyl-2-amino-2-deoxyglucuronate dehydrogenase
MIAFNDQPDPPTFALIGAAGYIAPKHGAAIKAVGGRLVAACDVHDAVGWLDKDWPECEFRRQDSVWSSTWPDDGESIDYVVICSPNHLHARMAEHYVMDHEVICEKPLALSEKEMRLMSYRNNRDGHRVFTIMNLRHHPEIVRAKRMAEERRPDTVVVTYCAPRGPWYDVSWKGDPARSGGIAFNIGIHIFDFLTWALGPARVLGAKQTEPRSLVVDLLHRHPVLGNTAVEVFLSTNPEEPTQRIIEFGWGDSDPEEFDLAAPYSLGDDPSLHAACYRQILAGNGPGIEEARPGIELAERITEALR